MYQKVFPTWNEIKAEVSKSDLLEIMEYAREIGMDEAIRDYIEASYEPEYEYDADTAYDMMRECA